MVAPSPYPTTVPTRSGPGRWPGPAHPSSRRPASGSIPGRLLGYERHPGGQAGYGLEQDATSTPTEPARAKPETAADGWSVEALGLYRR